MSAGLDTLDLKELILEKAESGKQLTTLLGAFHTTATPLLWLGSVWKGIFFLLHFGRRYFEELVFTCSPKLPPSVGLRSLCSVAGSREETPGLVGHFYAAHTAFLSVCVTEYNSSGWQRESEKCWLCMEDDGMQGKMVQ